MYSYVSVRGHIVYLPSETSTVGTPGRGSRRDSLASSIASTINFDFAPGFKILFESLYFEADSVEKLQLINGDRDPSTPSKAGSLELIPITTLESYEFDDANLTVRSSKSIEFPFGLDSVTTIILLPICGAKWLD